MPPQQTAARPRHLAPVAAPPGRPSRSPPSPWSGVLRQQAHRRRLAGPPVSTPKTRSPSRSRMVCSTGAICAWPRPGSPPRARIAQRDGRVADRDADLGNVAAARQVGEFLLDRRFAGAEGVDLALHQDAAGQVPALPGAAGPACSNMANISDGTPGMAAIVAVADRHPDAGRGAAVVGDGPRPRREASPGRGCAPAWFDSRRAKHLLDLRERIRHGRPVRRRPRGPGPRGSGRPGSGRGRRWR